MKMKKTEFFALSLTFIGFSSTLFKMPVHTLFILAGLLCMLGVYCHRLLKSDKQANAWAGLAGTAWLCFLLFKIKFWSWGVLPLAFAFKFSFFALFFTFRENTWLFPQLYILAIALLMNLLVVSMPIHELYYFFNIKLNNQVACDYRTWDRYSWFLYKEQQYEEAKIANQRAVQASIIAEAYQSERFKITEHTHKIENKNWERFDSQQSILTFEIN